MRVLVVGAVAALALLIGAPGAKADLQIQAVCTPVPTDCGGWYRQNVKLTWLVVPDTARIVPGTCKTTMLTRDTRGTPVSCAATTPDDALARTKTMRVDKTPPVATAIPARPADSNGWYRRAVTVTFSGRDATSGVSFCTSATYGGPDTPAATVTGACTDVAGNTSTARFPLRFDSSAPVIQRATRSRKPDYHGWYNHPVTWSFQATDALSGLDQCPPVRVANVVASAAEPVTAVCRDRAGNIATRAFAFRYDATPPAQPQVTAYARDRALRLRIQTSADTRRIRIYRSPGRRGHKRSRVYKGTPANFTDRHLKNGRHYRYTVVAVDQAGNTARRKVGARPGPRLKAPRRAAVVSAPPRLSWTRVHRARYYNVQLFRDGRKVLSAWPRRPRLQLEAQWRFQGRIRHLRAGEYRWFVWPGFGPRSARHFGHLIGSRTFTLAG